MTTVATGWWSQHGLHTVTLAGPVLAFAVLGFGADARAWLKRRQSPPRLSLMHVAAALSLVAAIVHVSVCPEHFKEAVLYGVFFACTSTAQFGWAALALTRKLSWLAPAGLLGNASLVLLWAVTRTVGVPLGPGAGEVERIGVLDIVATTCELGVVALCVVAIRHYVQPWRKQRRSGFATRCSTG